MGNILVVLVHLCGKTQFFIYRYGMTGLLSLYLLCALRIAVPIEFTDIRAVALKGGAVLVWAIVSFALLLRFGKDVPAYPVLHILVEPGGVSYQKRFRTAFGDPVWPVCGRADGSGEKGGLSVCHCFRPEKGGHKTASSHSPAGFSGFKGGNTGTVPDCVGGPAAGKKQSGSKGDKA